MSDKTMFTERTMMNEPQKKTTTQPGEKHSLQRLSSSFLPLVGVIAPVYFVLFYTIDGFLRPGYSPVRQVISDLGRGPNAWALTVDLISFGLLLVIFALGFAQAMGMTFQGKWITASLILIVLTGIGSIFVGMFPESVHGDPSTHFSGILHGISAYLSFILMTITPFLVGIHVCHTSYWRRYGWYSLLSSFVSLVLLALPLFLPNAIQYDGLTERLFITVSLSWYVVTGLQLFFVGRRS